MTEVLTTLSAAKAPKKDGKSNALSLNLQSFCRNDGSPGLVVVATGISQTVGLLVLLTHYVLKTGSERKGIVYK